MINLEVVGQGATTKVYRDGGTKQFEHLPFTVGFMEWCV